MALSLPGPGFNPWPTDSDPTSHTAQPKKKKRRHNNKNEVGMCVPKIKEKGHDPWKAGSCKMPARSILKEGKEPLEGR